MRLDADVLPADNAATEADPAPLRRETDWPQPLSAEAFYGLAGEIVHLIEPETESDPAAILIQLLTFFGNAAGSKPHFNVEATRHGTNVFCVVVGRTASARKGTSAQHVRNILAEADPVAEKRIVTGLSSGEGLAFHVRDASEEKEDAGVVDKRLIALESEFASPLRISQRDGNTLSIAIRQAWDSGRLQVLTKNSPLVATGAHISIVGHITKCELREELNRMDMANGLANRFLWLCAQRSKFLPEGGDLPRDQMRELTDKLRGSLICAQNTGEMRRDPTARLIWKEVYPSLSEGKPGLFGSVVSRAEAQVLRLSLIYALLDRSAWVRAEHLSAALAVWSYCESSAKYIFGDTLGSPLADEILGHLRSNSAGFTRTEISAMFGHNKKAVQIDFALRQLQEANMARPKMMRREKGRPSEVWYTVANLPPPATGAPNA